MLDRDLGRGRRDGLLGVDAAVDPGAGGRGLRPPPDHRRRRRREVLDLLKERRLCLGCGALQRVEIEIDGRFGLDLRGRRRAYGPAGERAGRAPAAERLERDGIELEPGAPAGRSGRRLGRRGRGAAARGAAAGLAGCAAGLGAGVGAAAGFGRGDASGTTGGATGGTRGRDGGGGFGAPVTSGDDGDDARAGLLASGCDGAATAPADTGGAAESSKR